MRDEPKSELPETSVNSQSHKRKRSRPFSNGSTFSSDSKSLMRKDNRHKKQVAIKVENMEEDETQDADHPDLQWHQKFELNIKALQDEMRVEPKFELPETSLNS